MAGYKGVPHTPTTGRKFATLKRQVVCVDTGVTSIEFLSSSDNVDFSYGVLEFHIYNYNPATDGKGMQFQVKTSSYDYNTPITSTNWIAEATYSGTTHETAYNTSNDKAQDTTYIHITGNMDNASSSSAGGLLKFYAPTSALHKHWMGELAGFSNGDKGHVCSTAGYFNTTEAIIGIKFIAEDGGDFDATIALYGVV